MPLENDYLSNLISFRGCNKAINDFGKSWVWIASCVVLLNMDLDGMMDQYLQHFWRRLYKKNQKYNKTYRNYILFRSAYSTTSTWLLWSCCRLAGFRGPVWDEGALGTTKMLSSHSALLHTNLTCLHAPARITALANRVAKRLQYVENATSDEQCNDSWEHCRSKWLYIISRWFYSIAYYQYSLTISKRLNLQNSWILHSKDE